MNNIEKSASRNGEYVGYCHGVWNITRTNSSYGNWIARPRDFIHGNLPVYAMTLRAISDRLAAIDAAIEQTKRGGA